jgi:energy-coupling factor transporter transmembrane protein EcfT
MVIVFFFVGLFFAKLVGAGKNQMLACGAIVLFYGLVSAGIAFTIALFITYTLKHHTLIKFNKVLGLLFIVLAFLIAYKVITREKKEEPVNNYPKKTSAPASLVYTENTRIAYESDHSELLSNPKFYAKIKSWMV